MAESRQRNCVHEIYFCREIEGLLLGVTVHEFMLISICQCLCHIMIVSWSHGFIGYAMSCNDHRVHGVNGFIGFVVSMVLWFHRVRGFMVS